MPTDFPSKYLILLVLAGLQSLTVNIASGAQNKKASASTSSSAATSPSMTLVVDETQAARRITFVHEEISARPGLLALAYPKWIPGEHGPTGPINELATIRIHSGDKTLAWSRDPEDLFTIRVQVPPGDGKISVDFDTLVENTVSDHQLLLAWNTVILYPLSIDAQKTDKLQLMVTPSVLLPAGWQQGSSLRLTSQSANRFDFAPLSLERLIDSPVLAGSFFRSVQLTSTWPAEADITGDSQSAIDDADKAQAFSLLSNLVDQDRAMFGFRHWEKLHLLISQSASDPYDGLEHEDSPWDGMGDAALSKKDQLEEFGWPLLAHEQSHSWDGKYRRPAELYSKSDYQGPERASLLWVYEGLNEYIGMLLATRAGFNDADYMRDYLGSTTAFFANEPARASSPLVDTAIENWVIRDSPRAWATLRRGQDYYDEGALIWLHADAIIREKTQDQHSLDDFLRSFLGQRDTTAVVAPYTREDVEAALSAICPYDWHGFFETNIYEVHPQPPTEGLEASGWRLVYNATPNKSRFDSRQNPITGHEAYSIGLVVHRDAKIADVQPGSPAYEAGLGPDMTIVSVDGQAYSVEVLEQSIAHPKDGVITLVVRNFNTVETHTVKYAGGLRFPHLERIPDTHDYLSEILAPRTSK